MNILTEYDQGDEVWTMRNNRAFKTEIMHISRIQINPKDIKISYELKFSSLDGPLIRKEEEIFRTKQELILSL